MITFLIALRCAIKNPDAFAKTLGVFYCAAKSDKKPRAFAKTLGVVIAWMKHAMERIIDGVLYEFKPADFVRLRVVETETGHVEFKAHRPRVMHEVCAVRTFAEMTPHLIHDDDRVYDDSEDRRARDIARAAQRAKQNVRHACKAINADTLLTLTYRENQTSLDACKRHLKEFARRMYRVFPDFVGVAGFEKQKRGAWHVHIATVNVPKTLQNRSGCRSKSFDLIRSVWRGVVGLDNGNIDIRKRKRHQQRSPARIASYLSKYITKAFEEGEKFTNRWTKFGVIPKPKKIDLGNWPSMREAIETAYSLIHETQVVVTAFLSKTESFFLAAERKPPPQPWQPA